MNALAIAAFAASTLVPSLPTSFETVNLRMTVDSCTFVPSTVQVSQSSNVIRVTQWLNNCFSPGTPQVADVRLGAFPAGSYRVELYATPDAAAAGPAETLAFEVRDPPQIAIFPPPPRPLTDYSGLWYNPADPGWGISLHQGPTHAMFGLLFAYDGANQPEWYSLQSGRWTSSTTWTAVVFRTTGTSFAASVFRQAPLQYTGVGTATLDFTQAPAVGSAIFSYTINGHTDTRPIVRMPL
jgi:hypothetical protein